MRAKLAYQERVFAEKEKRVSTKATNSLQEKVQEIERAKAEGTRTSFLMNPICLIGSSLRSNME
jgi:hypothetical protein